MKRLILLITVHCLLFTTVAFAFETTIVTRAGKGSALTWGEMDANVINLATIVDTKAPLTSPVFINGISTPALTLNGTAITATGAEINKLAGTPAGLTATELSYVDGVESGIQGQINGKADYQENNWMPVDASGLGYTLTVYSAKYTKIGKMVFISATIQIPSTANGSNTIIGGLPFLEAATPVHYGRVDFNTTDPSSTLPIKCLLAGGNITFYRLDGTATPWSAISLKLYI